MEEQRYISGEEYRATHPNMPSRKGASPVIWILVAIVAVGVCGLGYAYLRHSNAALSPTRTLQQQGSGSSENITVSPNSGSGPVGQGGGQSSTQKSTGGSGGCSGAGPCQR